jgi:hypothetical protein
MRARSKVAAAAFASLTFASLSLAQKPEPATVMSRDGATKLELVKREIIFQFTERGAREASAGVAPKPGKKNWNWMDDALQGAATGVANMRIVFPIEDVRDARYDSGTLTLYMSSRPLDAPATDRRGLFTYEDVPEDQAQAFVKEFRRLKASA